MGTVFFAMCKPDESLIARRMPSWRGAEARQTQRISRRRGHTAKLPLFDEIPSTKPPGHGRRSLPPLKHQRRSMRAVEEVGEASPEPDSRAVAARKVVKRAKAAAQGASPTQVTTVERLKSIEASKEITVAKAWIEKRRSELHEEDTLAERAREEATGHMKQPTHSVQQAEAEENGSNTATVTQPVEFTVTFGPS